MKKSNNSLLILKIFRIFIYILPAVLYFSYHPLIHFGSSESMNFEISLPLIWLVLFDLVSFFILLKRKLLSGILKKWVWLLFPLFLSASVLWSLNSLRGIFTVLILWLIYFMVYAIFSLKSLFKEVGFREIFWKIFIGSALFICFMCFLQCVLDLVGVGREYTLMCSGCTYSMFGFPHPNGFSIEPQFMGNLLLAPAIVTEMYLLKKRNDENYSGSRFLCPKFLLFCFFIFTSTLFLTFSRGAIYSFLVSAVFLSVFLIVRKRGELRKILGRVGMVFGTIVLAFLFTLNLQGIFSEVSKTDDTYMTGVSKAIDHLTLGLIDFTNNDDESGNVADDEEGTETAVFSGYVEESTNVRLKLSDLASKVWAKDFKTMMFGVGIGGAGQALYVNGLAETPKEIIQNQYMSLLLEVGIVGILLFILTLALIIREVLKSSISPLILALMVGYGVSLCFFSGLPNALQIYLLPVVIMAIGNDKQNII
ncbi:O-antigen ligase family protein [Candidatus Saccharibacteria bacterium]|nr:O-antigen ligase family protein [Candidatus Saccharibacteria bacterium]